MTLEIVGICKSTGEILVKDSETGDMSWESGTATQISETYDAIVKSETYKTPYEAPTYEPPEEPLPPPPPVPPEEQLVDDAPVPEVGEPTVPLEEVPAAPIIAIFMNWIVESFNDTSTFFYQVYLEVLGWVYPFWQAAELFLTISRAFSDLAWSFYDFSLWVNDIAARVVRILSWSTIWNYILTYIPNLEAIRDWFYYWWTWVDQRIADWWLAQKQIVLGWIESIVQIPETLISFLETQLNKLAAEWNNFVTVTLPSLPNWLDIEALIQSWTKSLEPFWEGWQDLREQITDFIKDPEQWFYDRLDEIFERYW